LSHLSRDARFGFRMLWRNPGFTAVAVLALALGIAANTAIFSVVHATLLAPLPNPNPEQLVMVWSKIQGNRNVTAAGDYLDWKKQSTVFQDLGAWTGRGVSLALPGEKPEEVQAGVLTPGFQNMTGSVFLHGRDFLPEEGVVGKDQVVILNHDFWRQRFGGDPNIVGKEIRLDAKLYTVVGVLAHGPADRGQSKMHLPLAFTPEQINHDFHWLLVMGRLKPGVTLAQANADMDRVTRQIAQDHPASNTGWSASVEPLQNNFLSKDVIRGLWLLLGAVGFVLLIACANVANLLLARGTARQREVAVRASLGASRSRVFRQFLTESLILAGLGGGLGIALAYGLLQAILALMPAFTLPTEADVKLNLPVLLFTLVATALAGLVSGCVPALQAMRSNLVETLKEGGRSSVSAGSHRLRRGLVVAEFALAITLLTGGGLAIHRLASLMDTDMGFRTDHLLTFSLPMPPNRLADGEAVNRFYEQLLERIHAVPGVVSASVSTGIPVRGVSFGMPFTIAGQPVADPSKRPGAGFNMVSPEYFATLGIRISKGRAFTAQDVAGGPPVAIVNETFAKRFFEGKDVIGQRLLVEQLIPGVTRLGPPVEWQIVGVYANVKNGGPQGDGFPEIDVPFRQSPWPGATVAVRTSTDPDSVRTAVAAVVQSMDPDLPVSGAKSMDQLLDESLAGSRFAATLMGTFAAIALLLATVGIYGVMSFAVAQRTHEIGLRMALGAGRAGVVSLILKEGMGTALVGTVLGLFGAWGLGKVMQGIFSDVGNADLRVLAAVALLLLVAAMVACFVPARRAASVDPMVALRQD
jgi:predicted permease